MPEIFGIKSADYALFIFSVLLISFLVHRLLRGFLGRYINKSSQEIRVDPTHYVFLKNALSLLVILIATIIILYSIPELKQLGLSLFASAGILAAILGFASQAAFSNIISGVFLVIFKPFRVGDVVTVSHDMLGIIEDVTLRHTIIRDFENKRYVIPNSMIDSEVIHNSAIREEEVGNFLYIKVGLEEDIEKVIKIIREEAELHPNLIDPRTDAEIHEGKPKIEVRVLGWRDYFFELRATCWSADHLSGFDLKTDLYKSIARRFIKEGMSIPVPSQNIKLRKDGQVS